jgi:maltose alpha-D-glucosyltransferase/alpha-amylase
LTEKTSFVHLPAYAGAVEWRREDSPPLTLALLLQLVPNQGDAWTFALDNIDSSLTHALTLKSALSSLPEPPTSLLHIQPDSIPAVVRDFVGARAD